MFRQVASRLLTRPTTTYSAAASATTRRPFATEVVADTTSGDEAFVEAWKKVVPNIDPPKTPSQYMHPRPPTPSTLPTKLTVNFVLPYASELSKKEVSFIDFMNYANSFSLCMINLIDFIRLFRVCVF